VKRILPKKLSALALAVVSVPAVWSQSTPPALGDAAKVELDSINAGLDQYESMARRSILSGGSKPVSFAGEAIGHLVGSTYTTYPDWMQADATQMKNSYATLRMGMVAAPNRNLRLWSKIAFNNALLGSTASPSNAQGNGTQTGTSLPAGYYRSPTTGEAGFKVGSLVFEDMCAGLVAKVGPTTWSAKAGGVLWNELSPLTVWKMQPRIFSWDYLPFELEQSTAQFYDYGTVKGEKSGRAAWNKKPFQGLQLESVELPFGLYANGFWGVYEGYNKNQPWLIPNDKNTELQMIDTFNNSSNPTAYRSYSTKGIVIVGLISFVLPKMTFQKGWRLAVTGSHTMWTRIIPNSGDTKRVRISTRPILQSKFPGMLFRSISKTPPGPVHRSTRTPSRIALVKGDSSSTTTTSFRRWDPSISAETSPVGSISMWMSR